MKRLFRSLLCIVLSLAMLLETLPLGAAATGQDVEEVLYVKDVKIFTDSDRDSAAQQGYILLNDDLNQDSSGNPVYLGYQTTTDPAEAVYDLKLMNMNGGYKFTNIDEIYSQQGDTFSLLAKWFLTLLEAYRDAYNNDSPMAHSVIDALNIFRLDSPDNLSNSVYGFGDAIVNSDFLYEPVIMELLLFCDSTYVDTIIKLLSMGIQDQNNWLYTLSSKGPYKSGVDYTQGLSYVQNSEDLQKAAQQLLPILQQHSQIYNLMEKTGSFDEAEYDADGNLVQKTYYVPTAEEAQILEYCMGLEDYYKATFDELALYGYGDQTLKDFFCSLEGLSKSKANQLYPLLASLTPGQYAALYFGSVPEMVLGTRITPQEEVITGDELTAQDFSQTFAVVMESAIDTYGISRVYLYDGVDEALLRNDTSVAFTEEAERHKATTGELDYFENTLDLQKDFEYNLRFVAFLGMGCLGIAAISKISVGITTMAIGAEALAAAASAAGFKGGFCSLLLSLSGGTGIIITLAVVAVAFLFSVIVYAIDYYEANHPDWDDYPIPDYLYDVTNTSHHVPVYTMYEAVKQNDTDEPADLNTFDGKQWLVLYASHDNADSTRSPIKAENLKVQIGDGVTPDGYTPLCEFGEVLAKDLNAYDNDNTSMGIYLFYQQDTEIDVESTKTYYIKDVYLQTGTSDFECIQKLENAGYTPLNHNLTPYYMTYNTLGDQKVYTYLGYKLTTVERAAVRDLRLTYDYNAASYIHGKISYGEHGTSGKMTLYASTVAAAGPPIVADGLLVTQYREDAPAGYEPVNLFSGGPAININHTDCYEPLFGVGSLYLYFLPETTFTEGPDYLGGIAHFEDRIYDLVTGTKPVDANSYIQKELTQGLQHWYGPDASLEYYDSVVEVLELLFTKQLGYDNVCFLSYPGENPEMMMYSTTKNPYRAIYALQGVQIPGMAQSINYQGIGFTTMTTFHTYVDPDEYISVGVNTNSDLTGRILVAGNQPDNLPVETNGDTPPEQVMSKQDPLLVSDLYISIPETSTTVPDGYLPVKDIFDETAEALVVKSKKSERSVVVYTPGQEAASLPYISAIYSTDYATLYRNYVTTAPDLTSSVLSRAQALPALAAQGATHFCTADLGMPLSHFGNAEKQILNGVAGQGNVVNIGYRRTADASLALRDLIFVCEGLSQGSPDKTIYHNGYKYTLLCEIGSWNYTGLEDNYTPRIYLYGSTDKRLGAPITHLTADKNAFVEGYYTATTVNGLDVMTDVRQQLYLGAGSSNKELWYMCGAWLSRYRVSADFYLHFRREDTSPMEEKPYISALQLTERKKIFFREDAPWLYDGEYYYMYENNTGAMARMGADEFLYIGNMHMLTYQRVSDPTQAITNILLTHNKNEADTLQINGITYTRLGNISSDPENHTILYYTCDPAAGDPISYLEPEEQVRQKNTDNVTFSYASKTDSTEYGKFKLGSYYTDEYYLSLGRLNTISEGSYTPLKTYSNPTETRLSFTGTETGKYISGIFIMDKNTLRQEKLAQGISSDKCRCKDIPEQEVYDRLKQMGATFVLNNYILTDTDDGNRIYIGITRTDTASKALKDVVLYTSYLNTEQPAEKISINRKTYYLVAEKGDGTTLPKAINLLGQEDEQDSHASAIYLYVSKTAGDYLYELTLDTNPIVNGRRTVLSQNGMEPFEDLAEQAKADSERIEESPHFFDMDFYFLWYYITIEEYLLEFNESVNDIYHPEEEEIRAWYLHTKNYGTDTIEETFPYIDEVFVTYGQSKREAIAELLKHDVDGFINTDANQDAGGDYVYIGYTRCDNGTKTPAITDLVICEGKNPAFSRSIKKKDTGITATYKLASNVDLNKDAGGDWLYLYYTKDSNAGSPLTDVYISEGRRNTVDKVIGSYRHYTVLKGSSDSKVDINDGAGGDYLYLIQVRETIPTVLTDSDIAIIEASTSVLYESPEGDVITSESTETEAASQEEGESESTQTEAASQEEGESSTEEEPLTGSILSGGCIVIISVLCAALLAGLAYFIYLKRHWGRH